jgi:hypothetical protein
MAKVKLNPVMEQMRGKIGDLVFRRYEDRVIVARKPDHDGQVATAIQTGQRERFRQRRRMAKAPLPIRRRKRSTKPPARRGVNLYLRWR